MHPKHAELYAALAPAEVVHFYNRAVHSRLIPPVPEDRKPDVDFLLEQLQPYSHAEVVLTLANDTTITGMNIIEKLIERPIYMCARGETGEPLTDIHGNPLKYPLGHRRGEFAHVGGMSTAVSKRLRAPVHKSDNRIVISVKPNPKRAGSEAYNRFNQYVAGQSVNWHLINTIVTRADIRWDASKNFITLASPNQRGQNDN